MGFDILSAGLPWFIVKLFFLFGIGIYVVFAVLIIKQIMLMTGTIETGLVGILRILGWLHFFLALGVFLLALVIL